MHAESTRPDLGQNLRGGAKISGGAFGDPRKRSSSKLYDLIGKNSTLGA